MKAIILAAGRGSRMLSYTADRPKCLVELHGKPLLDYQIKALKKAGVDDIAIVTGYRSTHLSSFGLVEFHNTRWADTNMVSSLVQASHWLENDACIVSYSDIFYEASAIESLKHCEAALSVTYDKNWESLWRQRFADPLSDAETFILDSNNQLIEIGEKTETYSDIQGQYMGLLKFTPAAWEKLSRIIQELSPKERDTLHMTNALQKLITQSDLPITAIPYKGVWGEVDQAEDLELYASSIDFQI